MFKKYKENISRYCQYFKDNKDIRPFISKTGFAKGVSEVMSAGKGKGVEYRNKNNVKRPKFDKRYKRQFVISNGRVRYEKVFRKEDDPIGSSNLKCDGINSKYMGKHLVRNTTRKQRFRKSDDRFHELYYRNEDVFKYFDVNIEKGVIVEGCYDTNKHTLQNQLIPEEIGEFSNLPNEKDIFSKFDPIVKNVIRKLKIKTLAKCNKEDLLLTRYNKDTKPGFRYEEYLLHRTKDEAKDIAYEIAGRRWDVINKGNFSRNEICPSMYTIGARNKRDHTYVEGEVATSRVVHMPEFHVELVSGCWTDRITEHIKENKTGPIYIGNSITSYQRLTRDCKDSEFIFEGDWKRYDSTLYIVLITIASAILRLYFDLEDEEIDNHFIAIYDSLAIKDYHVPGGKIYRAYHGVPSGVKSTSLIGSIINLIILNKCMQNYNSREINYIVGGDDFLIAFKQQNCAIDTVTNSFTSAAKSLGMQLKIFECKEFKGDDITKYPSFYKYTVYKGEPVVPPESVLERCFMPWNKIYDTDEKIHKFLKDVLPSLGKPMSHLCLFYAFYASIYKRRFRRSIKLSEVYTQHERMFYKVFRLGMFSLMKRDIVNYDILYRDVIEVGNKFSKNDLKSFGI